MTKEEIADTLEAIAQLLDLKGENPFKIRAYQTAARAIETYAGNLDEVAAKGELGEIEGVGKAIAEKIGELVETGRLGYFEELKGSFPPRIFELFEINGLGAKKIKALHDKLGVASLDDLEKACRDGRVAGLPGFGEKTAKPTSSPPSSSGCATRRSTGWATWRGWRSGYWRGCANIRTCSARARAAVSGGARKSCATWISSRPRATPKAVGDFFAARPEVEEVIAHGPTKVAVRLKEGGIQCDLRLVSDTEYPYALHHFTGSKEHHIALRNRALERGWSINEYRISAARAKHDPLPDIHDEVEFYRALGLDYIAPELRENLGEIEAALHGKLPDLIELANLRGTFHCHTTASDGHNTLEEMAAAAHDLGLQYLRSGRPQQKFLPGQRPGRACGSRRRARRSENSTRSLKRTRSISGCSRAWSATC